jgi:16S rRNA (cytidine1402-2'-O)-methyltransferase
VSNVHGTLYVVATPLGNLGDISARALETLRTVDLIAAEDTRHTGRLLKHFDIDTPMCSLHEHNERERLDDLIGKLKSGTHVALVSDAGTPLINDPGFRLVRAARDADLPVSPIPGPSAAIAALSVSGLATDRFVFAGYPPARSTARRKWFQALNGESATLVLYESPERIAATLADAADMLGNRPACVARELTKLHETVYNGTLAALVEKAAADSNMNRGEIVLLIAGCDESAPGTDVQKLLQALLLELPPRKAARIAAKVSGQPARDLYAQALALKGKGPAA